MVPRDHMGRRPLAKLECFFPWMALLLAVMPTMLNRVCSSSVSESESTTDDGG